MLKNDNLLYNQIFQQLSLNQHFLPELNQEKEYRIQYNVLLQKLQDVNLHLQIHSLLLYLPLGFFYLIQALFLLLKEDIYLPLSYTFNVKQYEAPVFAYAGNTSVWQGVDFMLDVYALVEKQLPNATLRLFSGNKDEFIQKCKDRGITNYELKYVPVNQLQDELHKCKYGFIIRDNHIVNLVATPTKMNSYLAAYMIPIFSDGVDDFKKNINLGEFTLLENNPLNAKAIAVNIVDFENKKHDFTKYHDAVTDVFSKHYNDNKYKVAIKRILSAKL